MLALSLSQKISTGQLLRQVKLGSGHFGTVYRAYDNKNGETYALKEVICKESADINSVKREADTMAKANHERIVRIFDYDFTENGHTTFLLLTEFCSGGDLNTRLNNSSTPDTNLKWICQVSEALNYLHSLNPPIVHRDLKADNVLLTDSCTENLKLGDFGLAREYLAIKVNDNSPQSAQTYYMTSGVGPIHWMAPEFYHKRYTEKADVFSLGGIFYAILIRDYICLGSKKMYGVFFSDKSHGKVGLGCAMAEIDQKIVVSFPEGFQINAEMKRLIEKMLNYNPKNRPIASDVYRIVKDIHSSE